MAEVRYNSDSPYANTSQYSFYLDVLTPRRIPAQRDDVLHTLTLVHQYRPDLLAFDLYKNRISVIFGRFRGPRRFALSRTITPFTFPRCV